MNGIKERYQHLKSDLRKVGGTLALVVAIPRLFRERITVQQAEEETRRLVDTRVERFLAILRQQIYQRPDSVYLKLLKHAGCELSDIESQVRRYGLESTLVELAKQGVYLTSDEYKGKREVRRGSLSLRVTPGDFERQRSSAGFTIQSSGTRNAPVNTFSSLDWRTLRILGTAITYSGHGVFSSAYAVYQPILSGRAGPVLIRGKIGIVTDRWFAPKTPPAGWFEDKYIQFTTFLSVRLGNYFGPGIAKPEFLEVGEVRPIVEWILQNRRAGKNCCIRTVYSNAVRIARCALDMGVMLDGTIFDGGGEPLTEAKRALMEKVGARVLRHYAFGGNISAGLGCSNPAFTDEVHAHQSLIALVNHPQPLDYLNPPIHPLLGTTLHPLAPRLLLNVENGDYATMTTRDCGCPLQKVGLTQHLHTIRSFEKFTSEGMNYLATDLFELLEKNFPAEYGGGPGDYQLVEEEDSDGQTHLSLLVHPEIKALNELSLLVRLEEALAQGSRNNLFMAKFWRNSGTLRVRREVPRASGRGKILPLDIRRRDRGVDSIL